jgi:hypothetical protein
MTLERVPQPKEIWELQGEPVEYTLKYSYEQREPPEKPDWFAQVLMWDRGASLADVIPDKLWAMVDLAEPSDLPDCMVWGRIGQFIVSSAFKNLVERFRVPHTEFFPVQLTLRAKGTEHTDEPWRDGAIVNGFWLMNCWNRVDAIDVPNSEVVWQTSLPNHTPTRFVRWKRLRFKSAIDADVFGFVEHLRGHRFVSLRFRDAAEAIGIRAGIHARPTQLQGR